MELEVLLSCMHQSDMSIAEHSQIQSDLLKKKTMEYIVVV